MWCFFFSFFFPPGGQKTAGVPESVSTRWLTLCGEIAEAVTGTCGPSMLTEESQR